MQQNAIGRLNPKRGRLLSQTQLKLEQHGSSSAPHPFLDDQRGKDSAGEGLSPKSSSREFGWQGYKPFPYD
jgi:hypothetical protein